MAYGQQGGNRPQQQSGTRPQYNNGSKSATAGASTPAAKTSNSILRTGLFAADPENEMSTKLGEVASVKVKETVTIPAGSYISLRTSKSDKVAFNLVVNPGKTK